MLEVIIRRHFISNLLEKLSLPEFGSLPSAKQKTLGKRNTRQRSSLPSVLFLTLGKELLCSSFRVSKIKHSAICSSLLSVKNKTLSKELLCRVLFFNIR
jgi:hypothetical protein